MSLTPTPDVVERAAELLARKAGLAFSPDRRTELAHALAACRARAGMTDDESYLSHLEGSAALVDALVSATTVGETYFFRDPDQLEHLRTTVLPELRARRGAPRVWSAGCASGEETYSLAILLADAGIDATVVGTDVSVDALERAGRAEYGEWSFRGVAPELRARHFEPAGARLRPRRMLRERVRFGRLNLCADGVPSLESGVYEMDLVLCRNVLIYLTPEAVTRVARRLYDALAPGGWLLTGPSDPPLAEHAPFVTMLTPAGVVYRRPDAGLRTAATSARPAAVPPPIPPPAASAPRQRRPPAEPAAAAATARPSDPVLEELRGTLQSLADRGEGAAFTELLARALRAYPLDAGLRCVEAVVALEQGRDADAVAAARRALYLDSGLAVAAIALGSALRRGGDLVGARRAYRGAAQTLRGLPPEERVPLAGAETARELLRAVDTLLAHTGELA